MNATGRRTATVGVVALLVLAGCGGVLGGESDTPTGGDGEPTPSTEATRASPEDGYPGQFTGPESVEDAVETLAAERTAFLGTWGRNVTAAALAARPERSRLLMAALPALPETAANAPGELSTGRLRELAQPGAGPRYVVLTDRTLGEYLPRIAEIATGESQFREARRRIGDENGTVPVPDDRLRNATAYRLYHDDASGLSHYRLVREQGRYAIVGGFVDQGRVTDRDSIRPNTTRFRGGWSQGLSNVSTQLAVSRQRRAVDIGGGTYVYDGHVESTLKVFERVSGATVTGRIENVSNATVLVVVELETNTGRTFDYVQSARVGADGRFEVTVPYPTTGSASPADGGTAVQATGDYSVLAGIAGSAIRNPALDVAREDFTAGTFQVSERQVDEGATVKLGTLDAPPALGEGDGEDDAGG